jgi:heme/copper-type cytochrome/quinol oxidase subunit 4
MQANNVFTQLNGTSKFVLLILAVAIALIALATIFLYKSRRLQLQLSLLGFLLQAIVIVMYFMELQKFVEGTFALTAILTLLIPIFFILAWLGIRKDEKLIKSMDRLR